MRFKSRPNGDRPDAHDHDFPDVHRERPSTGRVQSISTISAITPDDEWPSFGQYAAAKLTGFVRALLLAAGFGYVVLSVSLAWWDAGELPPWRLAVPLAPMAASTLAVWRTRSRWLTGIAVLIYLASLEAGIVLTALRCPDGVVMTLPLFAIIPLTISPVLLPSWEFPCAAAICLAAPLLLLAMRQQPVWVEVDYASSMVVAAALSTVIHCYTLRALRSNYRLEHQLRAFADIDELTQLPRRRRVVELARRIVQRADCAGESVSALYLDVDRFKQINDRFGHPAGDRALRLIAAHLQAHVRPSDVAGRLGGEEFVVILPRTDCFAAVRLAERLRQHVEALRTFEVPLTISIGVAQHRRGESIDRMIDEADAALLCAKRTGRNRVVAAALSSMERASTLAHMG
jgi:diguanylate cyclase (GGDEF)-like protein